MMLGNPLIGSHHHPVNLKRNQLSKAEGILFGVGSRSILLNIFGVKRTGFFPSTRTGINLHFELNLLAHKETISLKSKASGMQPDLYQTSCPNLTSKYFSLERGLSTTNMQ
jgi:hypothetical protein